MPRRGDGNVEAQRKRMLTEARILVRMAAEPRRLGDTVKARIARAATKLGWSFQRTEDIWRGEVRSIEAWEMDHLRDYKPE